MLANLFLDHVLDEWFERDVTPRMKGRCVLIRFADDFIIGCAREDDACRILAVLPKRFASFKLTIHPQKTCLVRFKPPRGPDEGEQEAVVACDAGGVALVPCASARPDSGTIPSAVPEAPRALPVLRYSWELSEAGSAVSERRARVAVLVGLAWGAANDPQRDVRQTPRRAAVAHTPYHAQPLS
jgi:hypothetical protein